MGLQDVERGVCLPSRLDSGDRKNLEERLHAMYEEERGSVSHALLGT